MRFTIADDRMSDFLLGLSPHLRPFGVVERLHLSHHRSLDGRETRYLMDDVDWKCIRYDPELSIISISIIHQDAGLLMTGNKSRR